MRVDVSSKATALAVLAVAAVLEVGGDALIRKGLRGSGAALVVAGCVAVVAYAVVVNLLHVDFSRLLGAYVGLFALASVLGGKIVFGDKVSRTTWAGLAIVLAGSVVIHVGAD